MRLNFGELVLLFCWIGALIAEPATEFEFKWHNNVGFGADLSMLTYALHVARTTTPNATFCLNRYRAWRYMPCANGTLECFFDPGELR